MVKLDHPRCTQRPLVLRRDSPLGCCLRADERVRAIPSQEANLIGQIFAYRQGVDLKAERIVLARSNDLDRFRDVRQDPGAQLRVGVRVDQPERFHPLDLLDLQGDVDRRGRTLSSVK